jgi:hypothetical protein
VAINFWSSLRAKRGNQLLVVIASKAWQSTFGRHCEQSVAINFWSSLRAKRGNPEKCKYLTGSPRTFCKSTRDDSSPLPFLAIVAETVV